MVPYDGITRLFQMGCIQSMSLRRRARTAGADWARDEFRHPGGFVVEHAANDVGRAPNDDHIVGVAGRESLSIGDAAALGAPELLVEAQSFALVDVVLIRAAQGPSNGCG
jgi:hypothetical protein